MSGKILDGSAPKLLWPGLKAMYEEQYRSLGPVKPAPLSVRMRLRWWINDRREAIALWIAPWL